MLAQSPPRYIFASDYNMGNGMDASPPQLSLHHARDSQQIAPHELQMLGQHAIGFMHTISLDHQPAEYSTQSYMNSTSSMPQLSQPIHLVSSPSTSRFAQSSRPSLPPLSIGVGLANTGLVATGSRSQSGSSTPSTASHPQATDFSRRSADDGSSSKASPTESKQFGRITPTGGRQRSAQACQKCRDRKTKCSGTRPSCKRCSDRGLVCNWASDTRARGPSTSRQAHHQRLGSMDGSGGPLSALPYPLSLPGSPQGHSTFMAAQLNVIHSAPPTQTTFQHFTIPTAEPLKQEQMRHSWPEVRIHGVAVSKGPNALAVMGEPIQSLNSVDDGWDAVECAGLEAADRHCQDVLGLNPFSLINALDLHFRNEESSNESSPLSYGQPISPEESSDSEPQRLSLPLHIQQPELHHPFPSYEPRSQLGGEMTKLLGLQGAQALDSIYDLVHFEGHQDYTQTAHKSVVQVAEQDTMSLRSHASSDGLFSQYFNADAFDPKLGAGGDI